MQIHALPEEEGPPIAFCALPDKEAETYLQALAPGCGQEGT